MEGSAVTQRRFLLKPAAPTLGVKASEAFYSAQTHSEGLDAEAPLASQEELSALPPRAPCPEQFIHKGLSVPQGSDRLILVCPRGHLLSF